MADAKTCPECGSELEKEVVIDDPRGAGRAPRATYRCVGCGAVFGVRPSGALVRLGR